MTSQQKEGGGVNVKTFEGGETALQKLQLWLKLLLKTLYKF